MCEVDLSPPPKAQIKNEWSNTFNPPVCLHAHGQGQEYLYRYGKYIIFEEPEGQRKLQKLG